MLDAERVKRLYARQTHGIKPGLETTRALLARLGNPERVLAAVHVAGTNGKGSVCAIVSAALATTGAPVGLYTSPHLARFNERFIVNGREIDDDALDALLAEVEDAAEAVERDGGNPPTFFECATAAGFLHFRRCGVRLAVVEVGMGGRLDATNVLTPLLSVITRIGMDHMEYLGNTLSSIAFEKAGIIKPGRPVILGAMPEEAAAVMARTARERVAPLVDAAATISVRRVSGGLSGQKVRVSSESRDYGTLPAALAASYQLENIATAVAALEALESHAGLPLPDDAVARGLAEARWPGRFQLVQEDPPTLLDGAHNPDGAAALVRALKDAKSARNVALVCGFCADKDVDGFFRVLSPIAKRVWTVPIPNPRSMAPAAVAAIAARYRLAATPMDDAMAAVGAARDWARAEGGVVVVCGSLFLVGDVLAQSTT